MDLNLKNITFIIVCFRSENVIYNCLNSLPKNSNKIIIENSKPVFLKISYLIFDADARIIGIEGVIIILPMNFSAVLSYKINYLLNS